MPSPHLRFPEKEGGRIGFKKGNKVFTITETKKGKPHWTREGQDASIKRKFQRKSDAHQKGLKAKREDKAEGGRIGLKKGGSDKNWIQKATEGMVKTKPCTGKKFGSKSCPPGSRRYNLAKTFKKMGRERKAKG